LTSENLLPQGAQALAWKLVWEILGNSACYLFTTENDCTADFSEFLPGVTAGAAVCGVAVGWDSTGGFEATVAAYSQKSACYTIYYRK